MAAIQIGSHSGSIAYFHQKSQRKTNILLIVIFVAGSKFRDNYKNHEICPNHILNLEVKRPLEQNTQM